MKSLLVLMLTILSAHSLEIEFGSYENTMPSNIYPINLVAGDVVSGELSWNGSIDLDFYLYSDGQNVMDDSVYLDRAFSEYDNPEIITYPISSSGLYYFRIDLFHRVIPTAYKFIIKVNSTIQGEFYDTLLAASSGRTVQQIRVENPCKLKIVVSGNNYPLYLYKPGVNVVSGSAFASDLTNSSNKVIEVVLDVSGNWNLAIVHTITSTTSPASQKFEIDLLTFSDNQCLNFCSDKANSEGLASGTTNICKCIANFVWDSVLSKCVIGCTLIRKATSLVAGSINSCECEVGFEWITANKTCEINCSNINRAAVLLSGSIDECVCEIDFVWSASKSVCERNCSDILYATLLLNGTIDECACENGYVWSASKSVCESERNCSDILYATLPLNGRIDECVNCSKLNWISCYKHC